MTKQEYEEIKDRLVYTADIAKQVFEAWKACPHCTHRANMYMDDFCKVHNRLYRTLIELQLAIIGHILKNKPK